MSVLVYHLGNVGYSCAGSQSSNDCVFLCVTERDEATTEAADHNATSFTEVDKRVKRRLLMGNNDSPAFRGVQLGI